MKMKYQLILAAVVAVVYFYGTTADADPAPELSQEVRTPPYLRGTVPLHWFIYEDRGVHFACVMTKNRIGSCVTLQEFLMPPKVHTYSSQLEDIGAI